MMHAKVDHTTLGVGLNHSSPTPNNNGKANIAIALQGQSGQEWGVQARTEHGGKKG